MNGYRVEGKDGVDEAVTLYNEFAGIEGGVKWPTDEQEMRLLQLGDPYLLGVIENIEKGISQTRPPVEHFIFQYDLMGTWEPYECYLILTLPRTLLTRFAILQ